MGMYTVTCQSCGNPFYWFSGNVGAGQVCQSCQNPKKEIPMEESPKVESLDKELREALIEAQKLVISAKDDLIANLRAEIERLKSSQITINPLTPVNPAPVYPGPGTMPTYPVYPNPFAPWQPYQPTYPWIITSGTTAEIPEGFISRASLPPGSIQSASVPPSTATTVKTVTNGLL